MSDRFLLIKAWGWGFWADMDHLIGQLLVAELTNRIPIVCWGTNSLYCDTIGVNAFDLYYEPVSPYTLRDIARPDFTYYPPIWNSKNLMVEDIDKLTYVYRSLGDLMACNANVVVSDVHYFARPIMEFVKKDHWAYGLTPIQIYRRLIQKYLKLKPDILAEINQFEAEVLTPNRPVVGVHIRGTDKVQEVDNLAALNRQYQTEINRFLKKYHANKIFLITDSKKILEDYKKTYGSLIITTDSNRSEGNAVDKPTQLENYRNRRRKGIEILNDTYLAARCDYFVGNGYSNVSYSVKRLRDWPDAHITLFYNTLKHEMRSAVRRTKVEMLRRRNREIERKLDYPELYGGAK